MQIQDKEIVVYDTQEGMQAHQELFRLPASVYLNLTLLKETVVQRDLSVNSSSNLRQSFYISIIGLIGKINTLPYPDSLTIHFVLNWELMSRLATWCFDRTLERDLINLLSDIGIINIYDINSLKGATIEEVFLFFLNNYKFGVLRKVCQIARDNILGLIEIKSFQVLCHIFSNHTKTIVASSL